jgi:hypothetical protein
MATISLIQGTDSLSASRVTLNDNFTALNDELGLVTGLLDPTTSNLSGVNNIDATSIDVDGGSAASFASTGNTLAVDTDVDGLLKINNGAAYDAETVAVMPTANAFASTSYIMTGANATLDVAEEGQEITIIASVALVTVDTSLIAGVSQLELPQYATATLRYHGAAWYLIAASPLATVA